MKKFYVLILLISVFFITGCGAIKMSAKDVVTDYLNKYKNNDQDIMEELDEYVENEDFTDNQKKLYKDILKKQYSTLDYEILKEEYDGNVANVTVHISVIDLGKAQKEAVDYLNNNVEQFKDEQGNYDKSLFTTYKLEKMDDSEEMTDYTIVFKVIKEKDNWEIIQLSNDDLEKIHGIYSYEE